MPTPYAPGHVHSLCYNACSAIREDMSLRHDGADRIQEVGLASVDTCHQPERPERKALLSLGPVPDTPRAAGDLGFAMEALSVCFGQKRRAITALVQVEPPEQAVGAYVAARQGGPKLALQFDHDRMEDGSSPPPTKPAGLWYPRCHQTSRPWIRTAGNHAGINSGSGCAAATTPYRSLSISHALQVRGQVDQ